MSLIFEQVRHEYFSDDEWNELPSAIQNRHKTVWENYFNCDEEYRFLMPVPDFMKKKPQEVPIKKKKYDGGVILKKPTLILKSFEAVKKNEAITEEIRKNPIRSSKLKPVLYEEEPEPDDDRYVFCDNCLTDNVDYCKKCGVLKLVPDKNVLLGKENRAKLTLPDCLEIKPSPIHNLGVFAKTDLEANLQFSHYEGLTEEKVNNEGYSWQLKNGSLINGFDEKYSNWLRYVNCSRHVSEQNIHAFQYRGKLYYRTCRNIEKGQELLVYYGTFYAKELGIEEKKYYDETKGVLDHNNKNKEEPLKIVQEDNRIDIFKPNVEKAIVRYFQCDYCPLCLTSEKYKFAHMKRCKLRNYKESDNFDQVYECKHCYVQFFKKELCLKHEERCLKARVRGEKEEKFECDICLKKFKTNMGLLRHIKYLHQKNEQEEYKCVKCTYTTIDKSDFKRHLNIHDKENSLKCKYCNYSASQLVHLKSHIISKHKEHGLTNIKNKIHTCSKCDYSTVIKSRYDQHIKVCLKLKDVKYFNCNICGYKCIAKGTLKRHIKTHLDKKELKCSFCSYECNLKPNLDNHILLKHSKLLNDSNKNIITSKVHSCPHCNYKTTIINHLITHKNNNH